MSTSHLLLKIKSHRWLLPILLALTSTPLRAQWLLDLESGLVFGTPYNEVRILSRSGTPVDLSKDLTVQPKVFYRLRLGYRIADRHTISALYAPLTVRYEGAFDQDINFNNRLFGTGRPVTAYYRFNSYRLTYRYDFIVRPRWRVGAGLTGKIRDADVRFTDETGRANYDNVGFVPLVNFYAAYQPSERWRILLEGDALGAPAGRAEDIFAGVAFQARPRIGVKAGYRVVEGGADNDRIYNFTWINYASVGLLFTF